MQDRYVTAGTALKTMFIGTIVCLVGAVLGWVPVVGNLIALAGGVVFLYGLYTAMPAHENYKMALYMEIASLVISLLGIVFSKGLLGGVMDILSTALSFLITYYICSASGELLAAKGDKIQADRAELIIKLYLVCALVGILCTLVSWIPVVNILSTVAGLIIGVVQVVAYILLVYFYHKASQALLA